jgi:hypothetical protein
MVIKKKCTRFECIFAFSFRNFHLCQHLKNKKVQEKSKKNFKKKVVKNKKIPQKSKPSPIKKVENGVKTTISALFKYQKERFLRFRKKLKLFFKKVLTNEKACAILVERC